MFDAIIRPYINKPLAAAAKVAARFGISADAATALGFGFGLTAAALVAAQFYWPALAVLLLSRFFDGLDGAIARQTQATDLGWFLDLVLDYVLTAAVVFAFALADEERNSLAAAFLVTSLFVPAVTSLAFMLVAAKRGHRPSEGGVTAHLGSLAGPGEVVLALSSMCALPAWFAVIAVVFGVLCWVAGGARIAAAFSAFDDAAGVKSEVSV